MAGFPRAALSLFAFCCCCLCALVLIVGASLCFECHEVAGTGSSPASSAGSWDLLLMSCCCAGLFHFGCGLSWPVTAAPPGGRPATWHVERRLFGSPSSAHAGLGNRLTAEDAACFVYAVLHGAREEPDVDVEFCKGFTDFGEL